LAENVAPYNNRKKSYHSGLIEASTLIVDKVPVLSIFYARATGADHGISVLLLFSYK
jgi:hypothetical protein